MRALPPVAAALALVLACAANSPHGLLRVELPGPGEGPLSPEEQQLARVVRDASAAEGLICQPGVGSSMLRCSAGALGQGHGITVDLNRAGTGYSVDIDQALSLPGRSSTVCDVQRRLADRIDGELGIPVTRIDRRSDCQAK